jgi:hypothetical protein
LSGGTLMFRAVVSLQDHFIGCGGCLGTNADGGGDSGCHLGVDAGGGDRIGLGLGLFQ